MYVHSINIQLTCPGHITNHVTKQHPVKMHPFIIAPSLLTPSGHSQGSVQEPKSDPKHSQKGQKGKLHGNPFWTVTTMTTGCHCLIFTVIVMF